MARKFYKPCGCGGLPECHECRGSGQIEDRDAEMEYYDYCRERRRDAELEDEREWDDGP
jgi:hypothetical protein